MPVNERVLVSGWRGVGSKWPTYILDTKSGAVETMWFENQKDATEVEGCAGAGEFRRMRINKKVVTAFVAFYAADETLFLWLNGMVFDVLQMNITVKRNNDVFLRTRFRVFKEGKMVADCRYFLLWDDRHWDLEFTRVIERDLRSRESRLRRWLIWCDKLHGKSEVWNGYSEDLTKRVESILATERDDITPKTKQD